ncbi:hypothetical protein MSP8887_01420 [Marinomonas spartinae]|uniref:hypothetical protein n=1 Tax=Marinomonas spartinae TaxID=1792290 RepID=UPI000808CEBD|nr:hypothetical protein [Marinomonas spartinae]SBS31054.1 hypothetical protein MSP8887_01420 [Marinomonas spartinae]
MKKLITINCLLLCFLLTAGCSVQLVSPYDERTVEQMEKIDQKIDHFYLILQSVPAKDRSFKDFSSGYLDIDAQIRSLERRQEIRDKNQETLKQTKILASLWQQDIAAHKKKNSISDFMIKRRMAQYQRLMSALIKGELAKKQ